MTKKSLILIAFCAIKLLLQVVLISLEYDLQRDEYLHLDQAHHLAWGYLSVPPFTSWISYVILLLGNSVFWVKFFPALFGMLTVIVVWKAVEMLGGGLFALILSATCMVFSVLLRLNTLFQPNSFDVLSWTAFYYMLMRYAGSKKPQWLFAGAVVFALGWMNKYNIAFQVMGLFPAIVLSVHRGVFLRKQFYAALCLALVLILPNLVWQYTNGFPVVHHMRELAETQLVNVDRWDFLGSQLLFFNGALIVILCGLYALLFYRPFKPYRFMFWSLLFTLAAFLFFRAKDYYAIGIYPIYIAFGAVFLDSVLLSGWQRVLRPVMVAIPLLLFIPLYQIGFPNKSPAYILTHQAPYQRLGLLRWEDGKDHSLPQDFADMVGWQELAVRVDSVYATLPNPAQTLVFCDNYGEAGAINYYSRDPRLVAHSFNADYIDWLPHHMDIRNVVLVRERDDDDFKTEVPAFDTIYRAARRINAYAREDTISIFVLRGAKTDFGQWLREAADKRRK